MKKFALPIVGMALVGVAQFSCYEAPSQIEGLPTSTPIPIPPTPVPYELWHERRASAMAQADLWISQIENDMINNYQEQSSCPLADQIKDSAARLSVDLFMIEHPESWQCKKADDELDFALTDIGVATISILDYCLYGDSRDLTNASISLTDARDALSSARDSYDMCVVE